MIVSVPFTSGKSESVTELAADLGQFVRQAAAEGRPLHQVERPVFEQVLRIGFAAIEQFLAAQGDGDLGPEVVTPEERVLWRSDEPVERPLRTVFGLHTLRAFVYAPSPKEKIALRPIDARLELPAGRASYLFQEFSQYFCVEQAFGTARQGLQTILGQQVSVDSLERINHRLGQQAAAYLDRLPTPPAEKEGELLVTTGDGKGVPLVTEDAANLAAFDDAPHSRPGNRRMATLAGVYSVDRHVRTPEQIVAALFREGDRPQAGDRPQPRFKHIRACFAKLYDADTDEPTLVPSAYEAFGWAAQQVTRRLRLEQPLIRLFDGQRSLWETADACLESVAPRQTIDILDILHVSQYVWRAAKVFHTSFEHREAFARDRLLRILQGEVRGVISGLRRMASQRRLSAAAHREIRTVCGYFQNNIQRMRYDQYLREGYPIATGVIEGACRHFVKDRMERSGMRWRLAGAQAMLNVRAVFLSSYWETFHQWRIPWEQQHLHPHRDLIPHYRPTPLRA